MPARAACTFSSSSLRAPSKAVVATELVVLKASAWAFISSSMEGNMGTSGIGWGRQRRLPGKGCSQWNTGMS